MKKNNKKTESQLPIVAITGERGGVEACAELLQHLPQDTGFAYIYFDATEDNGEPATHAVDKLSKYSALPVHAAKNQVKIGPNNVYVISSAKLFTLTQNTFRPLPDANGNGKLSAIDTFLTDLSIKYRGSVIGVVLSGDVIEGIQGLKSIKESGGITFIQDESATYQSLPKTLVSEGIADLVLSPKEIAEELAKVADHKDVYYSAIQDLNEETINNHDEDLLSILQTLFHSTGVDFSQYKMNTIKRRIIRRMMLFRLDTLKAYSQYLKEHKQEIHQLYQDLLINVTTFFRDEEMCEHLKEVLLPRIIKSKPSHEPIRIWVPACSTGQECYSLAMLLLEVLGDMAATTPIQIFATDLSETSINKARLGVYSKADIQNISPKRLQRFFVKMDGSYRIIKSIRDLCIFATHNLSKDPPFSRLDLISCCNLLIYLDNALQKKVIATFHYSLNSNGYLILGKSETVGTSSYLFLQHDKKLKLYAKKKDASVRGMFEMTYRAPEAGKQESYNRRNIPQKAKAEEVDLEKAADILLLKKYTPASVLINQDLDILQFRGATGMFIEPSPGKASLNLLKMAKSGLGFELRNIVHKAKRSGEPQKKSGLEIVHNGKSHKVSIEAIPLKADAEEQYYLVIFEEVPEVTADASYASLKDKRVKQLEAELNALREDMRLIVESQEAANEELQSANEEIVSSNEELQSINEELETSKEEIESSNEELITINQELQVRNEQLADVQEYAEAVFTTIRECLLILDKELTVKAANKAFFKTFRTTEDEVVGKIVYELSHKQWDIPRLHELLEQIIPEQHQHSGFEITHTFVGIGEKVMLMNARKVVQKTHHRELILLAIEDITEHKQAERIVAGREAWLRNMADNAPVMIWVAGTDKLCTFCNKEWLEYRNVTLSKVIGKSWISGVHPDDVLYCEQVYNTSFAEKKPFTVKYRQKRHDGVYRLLLNKAKPNFTPEGQFTGYIGSCVDIHEQQQINEELEMKVEQGTQALMDATTELERSNDELDQYAFLASHDLQEPLRKILTFADKLKYESVENLPEKAKKYLTRIDESSKRMMYLIEDLLNFSRISKLGKRFITVDLNELVNNVLSDLDIQIAEKNALVTTTGLPVISAIPLQMAQLFSNILRNSLKFTLPDRPPVITINSRKLPKKELSKYEHLDQVLSYYEIEVKDNGIGFKQEYADQIFTIFQRLHEKEAYSGNGVGLSLCRKIVNSHNGYIYAKGVEGVGASFYIILPVKQPGPKKI